MIGWAYDLLARSGERGEIGELRARLLAPLEGDVVEIGAGTGASLAHYRRARRVVAVEPDASMARRLPKRVAEASVPVEHVSATAERLPFPDETFDAAVATFVLCSVPEPGTALLELRRVLRPGGKLALIEHVRGAGRLARWQGRVTPLHRKLAGNCHLDRDTLEAVRAAGFDVRAVAPVRIPGSHPLVRPGIQGVATKISS